MFARRIVIAFLSVASVSPGCDAGGGVIVGCEPPETRSGEGTYYDADGTGNCGFAASSEHVAAMNNPDWDGSSVCGSCAEVTGPNATITVRIVDRCPECASGDLDLSMAAFDMIADHAAGRVPITWHQVECASGSGMTIHVDGGANPYYLAVNVRDHRQPLLSVERRLPSGSWVSLARQEYNVWVESPVEGAPVETMHLRATDIHGASIEVDVPVTPDLDVTAPQFPACE
jgi:expansin (peptidoglycan-binding protein)